MEKNKTNHDLVHMEKRKTNHALVHMEKKYKKSCSSPHRKEVQLEHRADATGVTDIGHWAKDCRATWTVNTNHSISSSTHEFLQRQYRRIPLDRSQDQTEANIGEEYLNEDLPDILQVYNDKFEFEAGKSMAKPNVKWNLSTEELGFLEERKPLPNLF
jgi:hypothetical protein